MRAVRIVFLLLGSCALSAQAPPLKTMETGDMNRSADPCDNFYEYANGAWRTRNPIPASMPRWGRRWKAGEDTKEALRSILDEAAAESNTPKGSIGQLIGDFHGACMDEMRVNQLGVSPLGPLLKQIEAMSTVADIQAMIRSLHAMGLTAPFGVYAAPDNHEPAQTVAQVAANGLGMPDRDYYSKTEERFRDTRDKYKAYITTVFTLAGASAADAQTAAASVFAMETRLAEASLDNVALRDPQATDHRTTVDALQTMTPHFDWTTYLAQAGLPKADFNVEQPKFMAAVDDALAHVPVADWKTYLRWQLLNAAAPSLSQPFVEANFQFYGAHLAGATEMKPRWKRCVEQADELMGEALGRKYVEKHFPPAAKARIQELVRNELLAMHDIIEGLDWMGPETKKKALEKLSTFNPKVGYPDKWRDYSAVPISKTDYWADVVAAQKANVAFNRSLDRQADRSRPLDHDAADLRCVLQPAAERDRLPRRHSAAAGVQRRERRCRELRRHRRGHRPRDLARLRRRGCAVRRAGPAAQLVGPRRPSQVQGEGRMCGRSVRRLLRRAEPPPQRQARAG